MNPHTFNPFLIGCIGALAPEIIRIYNLRLSPTVRWSWGYLLFSLPFILLGGFMAYILEPTSSYAAFYTGVSTPFIITTLTKDSERDARAIQDLTRYKEQLETELYHLQQSSSVTSAETAGVNLMPDSSGPTADPNTTSGHSALRGTNQGSMVTPARSTTNRYLPQSSSRRSRSHLARRQIVQTFLKGL